MRGPRALFCEIFAYARHGCGRSFTFTPLSFEAPCQSAPTHLLHLNPQELDYSSYSIDIPVSNVDVIDVKNHPTTTDVVEFRSQVFPDQNHVAVSVSH